MAVPIDLHLNVSIAELAKNYLHYLAGQAK